MNAVKRHLPTAIRLLTGLIFVVFGLNGFLGFLPMPPLPEGAGAFMGALAATGYMFPLIKGTEIVAGLMLLSGRLVPLALVLLAPVIVNIVLFHFILAPPNPMTFFLIFAELFLAYAYREAFKGVLNPNAKPAASAESAAAAPAVA